MLDFDLHSVELSQPRLQPTKHFAQRFMHAHSLLWPGYFINRAAHTLTRELWREIVISNKHRLSISALKLFDLGAAIFSFGLTTVLVVRAQNVASLTAFLAMRTRVSNFFIFIGVLFVYHAVFVRLRLYRSRRLSNNLAEIADILAADTIATVCFALVAVLFSIKMLTPAFLAIFWAMNAAVLCSSRLILRTALASIRARGSNLRHLVVFGTNSRAVAFARKVLDSPELGYRLLGFVDDDWPGMQDFNQSGFKVVCDFAGLPDFLRKNVVDEAVIYLPFSSFYPYWSEAARLCTHNGIMVRLNSDIFGFTDAKWLVEEFEGSHSIATLTGVAMGWPLVAKRALDIVISATLLAILSPLLTIVSLAVKLTSRGPVLFWQERVGLNKRRFKICKFRTMVPNAEKLMAELESRNEVSGPVFKMKNDPRITSIGRFLRRSSIDELPQLLNVLKGDMSLVGPRPLPVRDYEGFSQDWQRRRFSVKPGITCLWQVNGRSGISFEQWMLLDLQYMDEWSLWLDFKILAKTVPAVLKGSGAA
jgi:exopolysaccharide biosynthesis polyprenyl glycosylphosphotransferase